MHLHRPLLLSFKVFSDSFLPMCTEGQSVILTLADSKILEKKDADLEINENEDELENTELTQKVRAL